MRGGDCRRDGGEMESDVTKREKKESDEGR